VTEHQDQQAQACEPDEIDGKWLFAGLSALVLMLVLVGLLLNGLTRIDVIRTQNDEDIAAGHKYIEAMRERDAQVLEGYTQNEDGTFHVPVEQAMQALVADPSLARPAVAVDQADEAGAQ